MYKREKSKELFVYFSLLESVVSKSYLLMISISLVIKYWFFNYIIYNIVIKVFNTYSYKKCH